MTYCNQQIPGKNRRKRKQPSVSISALDRQRRAEEIASYEADPDRPMPIMMPVDLANVRFPSKF